MINIVDWRGALTGAGKGGRREDEKRLRISFISLSSETLYDFLLNTVNCYTIIVNLVTTVKVSPIGG